MKQGRNAKCDVSFPKHQTCEECGSGMKRTDKHMISETYKAIAVYECKHGHRLIITR